MGFPHLRKHMVSHGQSVGHGYGIFAVNIEVHEYFFDLDEHDSQKEDGGKPFLPEGFRLR